MFDSNFWPKILGQTYIYEPKHYKKTIILLHGILKTSSSMVEIGNVFERNHYRVVNISYPSTKYNMQELAENIISQLEHYGIDPKKEKLNYVSHSMGGLLIRILHKIHKVKIERAVMLGVPNKGSEIPDLLKDFYLYKHIFGPAGQELTTDQSKVKSIIGDSVDFECGIIAGNAYLDPICHYYIGVENDGKVSIESSKIDGMKDHIVITASHLFMPQNHEAIRQTYEFISFGRFLD